MENETYKITTLNDMCDVVTNENIELLIKDFGLWLMTYNEYATELRQLIPEQTKGMSNTQMFKSEFIWTNDGVNELKGVTIKLEE